ncbi:hypothetical protein GGS21DRAFT_542058 [Xylaria nigripes]|nr:hypothetical protein GGS21DRAFT_542058 [Xylaria nigripes]
MRSLSASFLVLTLLSHFTRALEVTPGSRCAVLCLDDPESDPNDPRSSTTTPNDIVCADNDYNTVPAGIKYQNCLDCLQTSNDTGSTESDTSWFIHNIRYSVDVCLYDFPKAPSSKAISSPCDIGYACQPLKTALEAGITNLTSDTYDYCSADGGAFGGPNAEACIECLQSSPNQAFLANFVTALEAGCQQKPAPGTVIGLSGSLFDNRLVNITAPPVSLSTQTGGGTSSFTTGAIVGIAVGASLLFLGGSGLFYVYYRKQKRLFANTGNLPSYNPWNSGGSMEPKTAAFRDYELRSQSPADYGGALGKEIQTGHLCDAFDANKSEFEPHNIFPTHPAYVPRAHSRQATRSSERPMKSNRPDSYAVQVYLSAAEGANTKGITPPPPAALRSSALQIPRSGLAYDPYNNSASHSRASSLEGRGASLDRQPLFNSSHHQSSQPVQYRPANQPFNIPPPPPRTSKVPFLSFPSLPKLCVPKRYAPPVITVQGATPTEGVAPSTQGDVPMDNELSGPGVKEETRSEKSFEGRRKRPPPPLILPPIDGSPRRQ